MKRIIIIILILFSTLSLYAEKLPIAIMDLDAIDVSKDTARAVSDLIRTELFNTGMFRVFERGEIEKILKEQQFGQTGLSDIQSAVKIGKLLSAKKILVGTVSKLGESYIVNARIIDVEKGEMEFADKAKSQSETDLDKAVESFARKIAARIQAKTKGEEAVKEYVMPKEEPRPSYSGTSGSGLRLKTVGYILTGTGVATGVIAFLFNGQMKNAYDDYKALTAETTATWTKEQWDAEYDKVTTAENKRNATRLIAIISGGLGVTCIAVDYLFLRPKQTALLDTKHNWNFAFNDGYRMEYTYRW